MADIETRVDKLDERVTGVEQRVSVIETKVDALIDELRDFKNELRQQNEMRATEIREIRHEMQEMQTRFYTKLDGLDVKIDGIGKHVRNLSLTAMAAIGAMVVTVIISLLRN